MKFLGASLFFCMFLTAFAVSAQVPPNFKGDFQSELRFNAGQGQPAGLAVGDVNGDGHPDIVVADYYSNSVSILLGNGDGTFRSPIVYATNGDYTNAVALADLNGDGHLDIVCTNLNLDHLTQGGTLSVLLGNGDGTFAPAVNYVAGNNLSSVVLADFNGDGKIDIATADVSSSNVAVLLNNGNGTFQNAVQYPAGANPFSLGAADFNGDGKMDLAVTNFCDVSQNNFSCSSQQTTVTVLLGRGDGTFGPPTAYQAGPSPFTLAIGDFNSDGKPDIVINNEYLSASSSISILRGNGDGTFQVPVSYPAAGGAIATGDVNGAGISDVIIGSVNGLVEILGSASGGFDAPVRYFVQLGLGPLGSVVVADVNGDGKPDVVGVDTNVIGVFLNAGGTARQATGITLASSPANITASVTPTGSTLQGSVTFYVDGQAIPLVANSGTPLGELNSSNQATLPVPSTVGTHSIVAIYSGDTNTQGSTSSALSVVVTATPTETNLSSSLNPSQAGQSVTFTAKVFPGTQGNNVGSVTFFDGSTSLGTVPVASNVLYSIATLSVSSLAAGTHSIAAAYSGGGNLAASASAALQQVVSGGMNLGLAPGSQSSATVAAGNAAQYALTIGGAGFSGQTAITCSGAPTGAACSVTPSNLMVSATTPSTLNVSVTTTSRSSASFRRNGVWMWAVLVFGAIVLPSKRNGPKLKSKLFVVPLFVAASLMSSCGGGGSAMNTNGTPVGTYSITVKAASGSSSSSVSLMLTVQ